MEAFAVLGIVLGIPSIIGWIYRTYLSHQRFMKVLQLKADMNARLLDRVGSDPAVVEVLKSDFQQQMFDIKLPDVTTKSPSPYSRVLTSVQLGFVFLSAGGGLLYIRAFLAGRGDQDGALIFGTLGVALGIGTLLSALAAMAIGRVYLNNDDVRT